MSEFQSTVEQEVLRRYAAGAEDVEPSLCCPVEYENQYLEILPAEIIEKDYGCGDPSRYVEPGETVLDLGSGGGKICYILSQKVGAEGRVIGVDFNDTMLALARKYQDELADRIGWGNVEFRKGRIQDLALPLDPLAEWLAANPVRDIDGLLALETEMARLRTQSPLVADDHVDVIVSNCVLNLVKTAEKRQLFREIHRVCKPGGRAVISDIVCDKPPTMRILGDSELWSGCVSGAFLESRFPKMFEEAGFSQVEVLELAGEPWRVVDGVSFRSMTVQAVK